MAQSPSLGPNPEPGTVAASVAYADTRPKALPDAELLLLAKTRFHTVAVREARMRANMLDDQKFRASFQWPDNIKAERDMDQRPCHTINRLPVFIRQVTNQQRQMKPAITINPVDSGSDPHTAEVLQGIIRHIEVNSQADIAYDTACDHQVTMGRGFFRVITEWNEINPWEQDAKIKRIRNPFTVYMDPTATEVDYHDARYAFIIEDIPKDEFVARYGEDKARSAEIFASVGDRSPDWMPEGKVRIAEYYYVETYEEDISLLSNGVEMPTAAAKAPAMQQLLDEGRVTVVRSRRITRRKVCWAKITGSAVLEKGEWPGRWIPIVPVLGDEIDINGEIDLRGMVRDAKDPQRMYNYWVSAETEAIALAPRSPFVAAEGQLEGHERQWKLANRRNFPYLTYKPTDVSGVLVPPPQRQAIEPAIAAIVAATKQSDNDLKAVTGIYDASLGERGPQEAARAILARQKQSDVGNINWVDNLARAMRALGRILLDIIPKVYDTPRILRILGEDDKPRMVMVHAGNADAAQHAADKESVRDGIAGIYDLSVGRYDVTVSVGPSYQSRREESVAALTEFMHAFPPAAPAIGDVLAENMDWPGAEVIAKRLRKMVPAEMRDDEGSQDPEEKLMAASQKLTQQGQLMEQMTQQLTQMHEERQAKMLEMQSRERIAAMQMETSLLIAKIGATKTAEGHVQELEHERALAQLAGEQAASDAERDLAVTREHNAMELQQQQALGEQELQHDAATTRLNITGKLHEAALKGRLTVQQAHLKAATEIATQQAQHRHEQDMQERQRRHEAATGAADAAHTLGLDQLAHAHEQAQADAGRAHDQAEGERDRVHALKVVKAKPKPKPTTGGGSKKK